MITRIKLAAFWWFLEFIFCSADAQNDPRPAIGFNLGPSYGTAVAHFANGTVTKLAKIAGSPLYQTFLQLELLKKETSEWTSAGDPRWVTLHKKMKELSGSDRRVPYGDAILSEMVMALRRASEAILGVPLPGPVVFSMPYIRSWEDNAAYESSDVMKARLKAGIERVQVENNIDPDYLGEGNAILSANNLRECPDRRCYGPEASGENLAGGYIIYFISSTNQSLYYTAIQNSLCYHTQTTTYYGTINPDFGLNQLQIASSQESFWQQMEDYLVLQLHKYTIQEGYSILPKFLLLVAGEGVENGTLIDMIRRAMVRTEDDPVYYKRPRSPRMSIELLVSREPTYAAAMGAAYWRRTMDPSYCRDYCKKTNYRPMEDETDDDYFLDYNYEHDEL